MLKPNNITKQVIVIEIKRLITVISVSASNLFLCCVLLHLKKLIYTNRNNKFSNLLGNLRILLK